MNDDTTAILEGQRMHGEILAAVRSRVDRAVSGEASAVLESAALTEAQRLSDCFGSDPVEAEAASALGWLYYCRAQALPAAQAQRDRQAAVDYFTTCFVQGVGDIPQPLLATLAERLLPAAREMLEGEWLADFGTGPLSFFVDTWTRIAGAVPEGHPDHAECRSGLSVALRIWFEHTGELPEDLDEAVEAGRAAVQAATDGHPDRAGSLTFLGFALQRRYDFGGELADLDEAVSAISAAVQATPASRPEQHPRLSFLGFLLLVRFTHSGNPSDVDSAVEALRVAVRTMPGDCLDPVSPLFHLRVALRERYDHRRELADLEEAVKVGRTAVRAVAEEDPDHARQLSHLGRALLLRFERTKEPADVNEAVEVARAAVQAAPDDGTGPAQYLSDLAAALDTRFQHTGEPADLEEAVEVARAAVRAAPDDRPDPDSLIGLCLVLQSLFSHTSDPRDLEEAVEAGRAAVRAAPDDRPRYVMYVFNLGFALLRDYLRPGTVDLEEALSMWEQVIGAATAPPRLRVLAARFAALMIAPSDPGRAAGLLEQAVLLLPEVAPRRSPRSDQQYALGSNSDGLAADATALALADPRVSAEERPARALRMVEAGRAVLLSQALDTRGDLTDLYDQHPHLAARFSELRELLDQDPIAAAYATGAERGTGTGHERHHLVAELEELLERIRACTGFGAFGLPPTLDELLAEAACGPVVTFNISRYRSDALLLTRDGITSCPLPQLTPGIVIEKVNAFYQAMAEATAPDRDRVAAQRTLRQILEWLWKAAAEPVLSSLEALGEALPPAEEGKPLPRVWWAPGGLLGLLPIHAAGFYDDPGEGAHRRTVLDRVISSYTPTIRTLRHARQHRLRSAEGPQSLIIAMPTTPGLGALTHVPEEARRLFGLLPRPIQLIEPMPASNGSPRPANADTPTAATVLARLPQCTIAHFACHGASNPTDPSKSLLFLHDHATAPLTVAALSRVNLDRAQLAYLSACSTADPGNSELLDEAIHLTSAFQLAGFPHVIGTLWPIDDRLAVRIAESFYTNLTSGPLGTLDPDRSAAALHDTIRAVRDRYPVTPSLWAAHLHAGA